MDTHDHSSTHANPSTENETPAPLLPWKAPTVRALRVALDTQATPGSGADGGLFASI